MANYTYKAISQSSESISGLIESSDRKNAIADLARQGLFVTDLIFTGDKGDTLSQSRSGPFQLTEIFKLPDRTVASKDLLRMTVQMSTALRAGLPLLATLEIIRDQQQKHKVRNLLEQLTTAVRSGKSLSEAMQEHGSAFSPLYISMIRVGEIGGILDQTTAELCNILQREHKVKTSIKSASAYPLFVLIVGLISVVIVITLILPNILETISSGVAVLPLPTRILMSLSDFGRKFGLLAAVALIGGAAGFLKWTNSTGQLAWDSFKIKIPIFGTVLKAIAVGRFARPLGSLTRGGIGILESLAIVRDTLGNEQLATQIDSVAEKVKTGQNLAESLKQSNCFPQLLIQVVSIGEQTGKLDELLLNAASAFESDADAAIDRFISIFPAMLILLLALVIGFIIAATLLPVVFMELGGM